MAYILASQSPRRKELLSYIIKDYKTITSNYEEKIPHSLSYYQVPVYLAKQKAKHVFKNHQNDIIISADTIVVYKKNILGKPKDKDDLQRMIRMLSGKTHEVITGVCIMSNDKMVAFNCKTEVTFYELSEQEIAEYIERNDVYDKAGGYAIQGECAKYVKSIKGDYYNVMGLPISKLYSKLKDFSK